MVLGRENLREQLRRGEIAPVYVLFGAETELRDRAAKAIADRSFGEGDLRDFNQSEFSLNTEDNLQKAIAAAEQLPMMAERRVVIITDVRVAATAARDTLKEDHEKALAAYLERPAESSVVIFVADELNGNRKLGKLLRAKTVATEFEALDDNALSEWAAKIFRQAGTEIDNNAMRRLIGLVGSDVRRLQNEVDKLITSALPEKRITTDLIDQLVSDTRELNNFALVDGLNAGDRRKVMASMAKVLDDGIEPLALVGAISYNYRRLAMVKDMMDRGHERSEVARVLNLRYNQQEPYFAKARRTTARTLAQTLRRIAETDLAIKTSIGGSGPVGARLQLEVLVSELAAS